MAEIELSERVQLPNKLWKLAQVAYDDLCKVERDKRYTVDMDTWHGPNGKCSVCLAGSVIANTLDISRFQEVAPDDFDFDIEHKLYAIDELRQGSVSSAYRKIHVRSGWDEYYNEPTATPMTPPQRVNGLNRAMPDYNRRNPRPFKRAFKKLIRDLKRARV